MDMLGLQKKSYLYMFLSRSFEMFSFLWDDRMNRVASVVGTLETIRFSILQLRKLRHREAKWFVQGQGVYELWFSRRTEQLDIKGDLL